MKNYANSNATSSARVQAIRPSLVSFVSLRTASQEGHFNLVSGMAHLVCGHVSSFSQIVSRRPMITRGALGSKHFRTAEEL